MKAPTHLKHKPIVSVDDYHLIDGINDTDAKAISIGKAQWDKTDISVKVWRKPRKQWSRQSEELPVHRAFDLSLLALNAYLSCTSSKGQISDDMENMMNEVGNSEEIKEFFKMNKNVLKPRIEALKKVIDKVLKHY